MGLFLDVTCDKSIEEIINANLITASKIRKQISLLDSTNKFETEDDISQDENIFEEFSSKEEIDDEEEYEYYYNNIQSDLKDAKTIEEQTKAIYSNLPVLDNKNYANIVRRIILEFIKEKKIYDELKVGESEEEIISLEEKQKEIDYFIELIREHHNISDNSFTSAKIKNRIIFFKTLSGRIYAESDLASISEEYYQYFKELFQTIENGTFKNVKRFTHSHDTLKGISEVKGFKVRIVFDRIDANTYVIIDIFVKKSDKDTGYVNQLTNRIDLYKKSKDVILSSLSEEYINEHENIYLNIIKGLDSKNIVKTKRM